MAVRKFIKMYNIRNEDVDDKGNVNPDAALYPYYATYTKGASVSDKESFLFNKNVLKEATRSGGAFDWYDSSTYSDERMKDVYAGWSDVTLSDKQLKYIYDDFRKFKKGATQSNITKGLRGLGQ